MALVASACSDAFRLALCSPGTPLAQGKKQCPQQLASQTLKIVALEIPERPLEPPNVLHQQRVGFTSTPGVAKQRSASCG